LAIGCLSGKQALTRLLKGPIGNSSHPVSTMAAQGPHDEGIALIQQALAATLATGIDFDRRRSLSVLAEAFMEAARFDAERAYGANEHENRNYEAEIQPLKASLDLALQSPRCRCHCELEFKFEISV
jgi:hypothetical protein